MRVCRSLSVPVHPLGFSTTVVSSMEFGMHVLSMEVINTTSFLALQQYDEGSDTVSRRYMVLDLLKMCNYCYGNSIQFNITTWQPCKFFVTFQLMEINTIRFGERP